MRHEAHYVHRREHFGHSRALVAAAVAAALSALTTPALAELPRAASRALSAATPEARAFACTEGLPALAFTSPRARVLADGTKATELALACGEAGGVRALDVAGTQPSAWAGSQRASGPPHGPRTTFLHETARARARRTAIGVVRYDLIVVAPERSPSPDSLLSTMLPRVQSETVEGMRELLAALSSEGGLFGVLAGEPAALRFALTAMDALRLDGTSRPSTRIIVQRAVDHYGVWVGRGPMAMDTLLDLHARDRARRESGPRPPVSSLPPWAASAPALLHTTAAFFDERMSRILHEHERASEPGEPPAYAFDVAPLRDERPLFFELTRSDRPDTWLADGLYVHALELLGLALAAWLGLGVLEMRIRSVGGRRGLRQLTARLLWVISSGAVLAWSAQAMSRVVADAQKGTLAAVSGLALGGAAGWWAARRRDGRRGALVALAATAAEGALALAAWQWTWVVARLDSLPSAQGVAFAVTTSALLGAASVGSLPDREHRADTHALTLARHACALLSSFAVVAAMLLFSDYRLVGAVAAATGVLSIVLSSRAGKRLHGSATSA